MDTTTPQTPVPPTPRRLRRTAADRVVGGVCGGLGRHFGVDPVLFRIGALALVLLGGLGVVLYLAALLLVPLDDPATAPATSGRDRTVAVGVLLLVGLAAILSFGGPDLWFLGVLVPLGLLALAGLAIYWLVTGGRPEGDGRTIARSLGIGIAVLVACTALATGSFWAAATGGGTVVAGLVVATGLALVVGAFAGGARWLVLPAIAVALPLAFVSAAGIDLEGGVGERTYRPVQAADLRDDYRLGAGQLVLDLRGARLPSGRRVHVSVGMGHALVLVDRDVCVATRAQVGIGGVELFESGSGGVDVEVDDPRRPAGGATRIVLDADVGLGLVQVAHDMPPDLEHGPGRRGRRLDLPAGNSACVGATRTAGEGRAGA